MLRLRCRHENYGYDGRWDRQCGRSSKRRVALAEQALGLHWEKYSDLNVRHFHETLRDQHSITLS